MNALDGNALEKYIDRLKDGKPNLANLPDDMIYELMSITRENQITLSTVLLFSPYPQAYFPGMSIIATVIPGTEPGVTGSDGERFLDNQRIEGTIMQMLDGALQFVKRNLHNKTIINPDTGKREDRTDYPLTAVREAVLNALVHRDYSIHTEAMPIQLMMFEDRMEIHSPGGIYGRMRADQLGKVQPDTRNPVLAAALEVLGIAENRYSGIPTIRREMREYGLQEPIFADEEERSKLFSRKQQKRRWKQNRAMMKRLCRGFFYSAERLVQKRKSVNICSLVPYLTRSQKYVLPLVRGRQNQDESAG